MTNKDNAELLAMLEEGEELLGVRFPAAYRKFVLAGGLSPESRLACELLSPDAMQQALGYLADQSYLPFAENGCGDCYCWRKTEIVAGAAQSGDPGVFFADHETGEFERHDLSFSEWLAANWF